MACVLWSRGSYTLVLMKATRQYIEQYEEWTIKQALLFLYHGLYLDALNAYLAIMLYMNR
ncbi:hypothetical protein ASPWEDRAFT_37220 [Aspergillus wentii DTO 134E9]|uniref:Uncharacterized protein n=1 Tax=Aspergillus wentii DTO 134E9 TaxID=1073089 RepID=A0A1L9RWY9_ASPWE|nr:uncharacterized protein ASPWEDRAFT_37220 [Aspergillus wentii DTO 134E9]OJJ39435.1 hypothetical protein ASPWEDRAFT_37220 [Aspergillus wentii DTO 134E9]